MADTTNAVNEEAIYTHGHDPSVLASHARRTARDSAAYLLAELRPGMNLLDVGFGPGTITLDLAEAVAPGEVIGIENADAPFEVARAFAGERGDIRTVFEHGDVMDLHFADNTFDVVHAHQVLQHLSDPVGALREMSRVCKPGGIVAVRDADYAAMAWYPDSEGMEGWRQTYRLIAHNNGAEPDAGRHLRRWVRLAGFTDVRLSTSNWVYATDESCRWWGNSQAERILGDAFIRQADACGISRLEVESFAEGWREWGQSSDAWFLLPNTEILARKGLGEADVERTGF